MRLSNIPLISFIRIPVIGSGTHPKYSEHILPEILKLISSAKTLFPNKVTLTGTGRLGLGRIFPVFSFGRLWVFVAVCVGFLCDEQGLPRVVMWAALQWPLLVAEHRL